MNNLLGIDLGTSSVKLLLRHKDGRIEKAREPYEAKNPEGWLAALVRAANKLDLSVVDAVGLSSQVGTYLVNESRVLEWSSPVGLDELREVKTAFPQQVFIREITMPHPDIISYPLPRLMHILRTEPDVQSVCMPKEILIRFLTGQMVSDPYSWRGLANLETGEYSRFFLEWLGLSESVLPPLLRPDEKAGVVTCEAARLTGLKKGVPVYTGCNDFFAALAGSSICKTGDMFDITGTSEHVGGISQSMLADTPPVSGRYFQEFVRYGVTGSSGASLDYAKRLYNGLISVHSCLTKQPPLFLPYVNGERCPVCDPDAKGVFFGIGADCTAESMAYSVREGISFNLKQIVDMLDLTGESITVTGGAAQDEQLNQIKADVLGMKVVTLKEPEASALGAAMLAGVGLGAFEHLEEAAAVCVEQDCVFWPQNGFDYTARYAIYKQLYPLLKDQFGKWREIPS